MPRDIKELKSKKIEALEQDAIEILEKKFIKTPETQPNFAIQTFTNKRPSGDILHPTAKKPNLSTQNFESKKL